MPRVACLMMQKDEGELLGAWVKYHAALFGIENLFIWDNGSTHVNALGTLREVEAQGVNVDWSRAQQSDFVGKGSILGKKIKDLDGNGAYDFFIPLDCDEFFAIEDDGVKCTLEAINGALDKLNDDRAMHVSWAYYNNLADPNLFWRWGHSKTFFAAGTFGSLDHGYHNGTSRKAEGVRETDFVHMHLHFKPYASLVQGAKNKLAGHVDTSDHDALKTYRGVNYHVAKHLLVSEAEYHAGFRAGIGTYIPQFAKRLAEVGASYPFQVIG